MNCIIKKIEKRDVTNDYIKQIFKIEGEDGYTEEQIKCIWQDENFVNDNFVCFCDGKIVGDISFNPNSKRRNGSVYMVNLTVAEEFRRKGIAQNLIYFACTYYKSLNSTLPMSLSVDKDNTPAISLYKKVGYEIKDPICYADIDDEQYIMECSLNTIIKRCENICKIK